MPPRWRRSRRRRSPRRAVPVVIAAAVAAAVVALLAGALADIGPASGAYRRTVDRGFAALAGAVAVRSDATGAGFTPFLLSGPGLERTTFLSGLAQFADQAADERDDLDNASVPAPADGAGAGCVSALSARAGATATTEQALEGLLGGPSGDAPLAPAVALSDLEQAGASLAGADSSWAACRHRLRLAPGSARLRASVWETDAVAWSPAHLAALVDAVSSSRSLAADPALALPTYVTTPALLPGPGSPVVSPSRSLGVSVVVSDTGNVDQPRVTVTATLTADGGTATVSRSVTVALDAGHSVSVSLGQLAVSPGASYVLVLNASAPSGTSATLSTPLVVAAYPVTTTTTTTTTTTPRRS